MLPRESQGGWWFGSTPTCIETPPRGDRPLPLAERVRPYRTRYQRAADESEEREEVAPAGGRQDVESADGERR